MAPRIVISSLAAAVLVACGGGGHTPAPTPTPTPTPTPRPQFAVVGHIVEYGTGRPVPGATVTTSLQVTPFTADANGEFRIGGFTYPATFHTTIEAQGYIPRETYVRLREGTGDVTLDLLRDGGRFSLEFYRQLARNANEQPELHPLWRLTDTPSVYIRTVDQNGRAIEAEALRSVKVEIPKAVANWSGGKLSVSTIEMGIETRPRTPGWMVVNILRDKKTDVCGRAYVGVVDGQIELWDDACSCGSNKLPGGLIAHEVGHAMGFRHVADEDAIMHSTLPGRCPKGILTEREAYHAAVAYSRARGNTDQDVDPETMTPLSVIDGPLIEN